MRGLDVKTFRVSVDSFLDYVQKGHWPFQRLVSLKNLSYERSFIKMELQNHTAFTANIEKMVLEFKIVLSTQIN